MYTMNTYNTMPSKAIHVGKIYLYKALYTTYLIYIKVVYKDTAKHKITKIQWYK